MSPVLSGKPSNLVWNHLKAMGILPSSTGFVLWCMSLYLSEHSFLCVQWRGEDSVR